MANRNFANGGKFYSMHVSPVKIDCSVNIGSSGATSGLSSSVVRSVTRMAAGIYQVQLMDNYNALYNSYFSVDGPVTGSAIAGGSFVAGTLYQIVTLGTTNFNSAGLPTNVTAAVGQNFIATGIGAGTGTVKAVAPVSSIINIAGPMMNPTDNTGSIIIFQALAPTSSSVTTLIPTEIPSGSVLNIEFLLSNSSVVS